MTTEDFEKAQLRLNIERLVEKTYSGADSDIEPNPDKEEFRKQMQEYFERRD